MQVQTKDTIYFRNNYVKRIFLGNNTTKYTPYSGSKVTLTTEELEELIEEQDSQLVEELEEKIVKLESEIDSLKEDITDNKAEIYSLNKEIKRLHSKV